MGKIETFGCNLFSAGMKFSTACSLVAAARAFTDNRDMHAALFLCLGYFTYNRKIKN